MLSNFLTIFLNAPNPNLTRAERQAMWLIEDHHGIQWKDGMVLYSMARGLITKMVMGGTTTDDKIVVYIKEHEKRKWLWNLLLDEAKKSMLKILRRITKT